MTCQIAKAVEQHRPVRLFALFSGGNDSICSTHYAMNHGAHEVVHVNTGIGVEETREFVRETCQSYGWPLRELHPPEKTYRDFVLKYGFPGPGAHRYAYVWLKEKALRILVRETKKQRGDRVGLVTGVRCQESARRMGYVEPIARQGAWVWIAPLYHFSTIDIHAYKQLHRLPTNPVTRILGMSGECLCGAFAQPGEIRRIEKSYPVLAAQIHKLEADAAANKKHATWGTRPRKQKPLDQHDIPFMPLCSGFWMSGSGNKGLGARHPQQHGGAMNDKMQEELLKRLDVLAEKLGASGKHLWEVLVRQFNADCAVILEAHKLKAEEWECRPSKPVTLVKKKKEEKAAEKPPEKKD